MTSFVYVGKEKDPECTQIWHIYECERCGSVLALEQFVGQDFECQCICETGDEAPIFGEE